MAALIALDVLDVKGGVPASHQRRLLLLVVGVQEDELVGVEKDRILETEPLLLLEVTEILTQFLYMPRLRFFLTSLQTIGS